MPTFDLRAFREAHPRPSGKPMSRAKLAEHLGLPNPTTSGKVTVARWESGAREPPRYLALALAEIERKLAAADAAAK